jgi:hypothetical protein
MPRASISKGSEPSSLVRYEERDVANRSVRGVTEGQSVHVVPVQVAEQRSNREMARRREISTVAADPSAGVEQQRRHFTVVREGHARRVAAVALELLTRRRRRTPDAEEGDSHAVSRRSNLLGGVRWRVQ